MGTDGFGAEPEAGLKDPRLWWEDGFSMTTLNEETLNDEKSRDTGARTGIWALTRLYIGRVRLYGILLRDYWSRSIRYTSVIGWRDGTRTNCDSGHWRTTWV